jgi:hypothetical protein
VTGESNPAMQKILIRGFIILFGLGVLAFVAVILIFGYPPTQEEKLRILASKIEKRPTAITIRRFLVEPSDGAACYLHMALAGRVFARYPRAFRDAAGSLEDGGKAQVEMLATIGTGVFEYYPELEPQRFKVALGRADWLAEFRTDLENAGE